MPTQKAQNDRMTRFQRLIQSWIDADPARNPRDLARAAGVSPSVIYALLRKPLVQIPADETIAALASAGVATESQLRFTIAVDLGMIPTEKRDLDAVARQVLDNQNNW